jgi:AcrR family transcriptional regulator
MDSEVESPGRSEGLVGYGERAADADEARLPAPAKQARGAEKRDRIYEAAIARFAADGVAATRIEDVIADAEVSWATFFRYFPRKGDVLLELAARHFRAHVWTAAEAGFDDGRVNVRTVIERTFAALLRPAETSAELHNAALLEVFAHPARFAATLDEGHPQPLVGVVAELLAEAERRGEIRPGVDPGAAALTVVAGALFPAVQAAALGADPTGPMAAALDMLWTGLEPG